MAPRRWTAAPAVEAAPRRAQGSFSKRCHRGGRASCTGVTATSKCRRSRCLEIAPSPAKGEQPPFFFWEIHLYPAPAPSPCSPASPRPRRAGIACTGGVVNRLSVNRASREYHANSAHRRRLPRYCSFTLSARNSRCPFNRAWTPAGGFEWSSRWLSRGWESSRKFVAFLFLSDISRAFICFCNYLFVYFCNYLFVEGPPRPFDDVHGAYLMDARVN